MVDTNKILLDIYQDTKNPNSYTGVQKLLHAVKKHHPSITKHDIIQFLKSQKAHTLHKITQKHFLRRRILASKPGIIASCDLADLSSLARYNNGYKYIVCFIDVFSRFAQCIPVKRKNATSIHDSLNKILNSGHFPKLNRLNTDEGKEFYNEKVNKLLNSKGITLYSVSSREIKAAIAERFIRTLKGKLFRYMTHQNTKKYVNILTDVVNSYNHTQHRGLGGDHTPSEIHQQTDPDEIQLQFNRMYKNPCSSHKRVISNLPIGEYVRLSQLKPTFKKGYTIQNTFEIFKIVRIDTTQSPTVYFLEDLQGEPIKGIFYREELIPTTPPASYEIDIIKSKIVSGRKKYFVKWRGYPDKFNTWIDESQLSPV